MIKSNNNKFDYPLPWRAKVLGNYLLNAILVFMFFFLITPLGFLPISMVLLPDIYFDGYFSHWESTVVLSSILTYILIFRGRVLGIECNEDGFFCRNFLTSEKMIPWKAIQKVTKDYDKNGPLLKFELSDTGLTKIIKLQYFRYADEQYFVRVLVEKAVGAVFDKGVMDVYDDENPPNIGVYTD